MFSTRWALENFIGRLAALSPLSQDDAAAISGLTLEPLRLRGNVDIVAPGQEFHDACLVVSGLVASFVQLSDGRRQLTAFHMPGDIAGIHRVATAMAGSPLQTLSTATVVKVPVAQLKAIAFASPKITHAFFAYASVEASILAQWAVNVGRRDAQSRMAHFLCEIGIRSECSGLGSRDEFILEASQSQIGDALGLTSVHVNRTLKALRQSKAISLDGRIVRILNWPLLAAQGDFDQSYLRLLEQVQAA